jgi:hypothetical protein
MLCLSFSTFEAVDQLSKLNMNNMSLSSPQLHTSYFLAVCNNSMTDIQTSKLGARLAQPSVQS